MIKRLCIIGLWYMGIPTVNMFPKHVVNVVRGYNNSRITEVLSKGDIHIEGTYLKEVVQIVISTTKLVVQAANTFITTYSLPVIFLNQPICARRAPPPGSWLPSLVILKSNSSQPTLNI